MFDTTFARIVIEVVSAIACFILVKFMIKPYRFMGEGRYLGLPLGFGFLGLSYSIAAVAYSEPPVYFKELLWLQSLLRTFAFVFLAATYFFSEKRLEKVRIVWNITFSVLIVTFVTSFLFIIVAPQIVSPTYAAIQFYVRIFNLICISYLIIHTLRNHIKNPNSTSIWIPLGFILFGINQYSLLAWYIDKSYVAFTGALILRLMALTAFLVVACHTFCSSKVSVDE